MISLLHATRGRWDLLWTCIGWWLGRSVTGDLEYILAMDEDDPMTERVAAELPRRGLPVRLLVDKHAGNNDAWNHAYRESHGQVVVQVSDDFEPPAAWDATVISRLQGAGGIDKPLVLGVADPHFGGPYSGDGLLTIIIATRAYLERQGGYLLYPEYPSLFSDNDLTDKAAFDGVLVDAYDVTFAHHWHGAPNDPLRDDTYARHATTRCNGLGGQIWGARWWAGMPDTITLDHDDAEAALQRLCPPGLPEEQILRRDRLARVEHHDCRDVLRLVNKKFPLDDPRAAWLEGQWAEARAGVAERMAQYHLRACGGRFLMHAAHFIWYKCTEKLKDRPLVGVRDPHV